MPNVKFTDEFSSTVRVKRFFYVRHPDGDFVVRFTDTSIPGVYTILGKNKVGKYIQWHVYHEIDAIAFSLHGDPATGRMLPADTWAKILAYICGRISVPPSKAAIEAFVRSEFPGIADHADLAEKDVAHDLMRVAVEMRARQRQMLEDASAVRTRIAQETHTKALALLSNASRALAEVEEMLSSTQNQK